MRSIPRTRFSTRLSGSERETAQRIRSLFQRGQKRPPAALLVPLALLIALCGSLVGCRLTDGPAAISQRPDTPSQSADDPRREDFWTFLLVGVGGTHGQADALMVASYDTAAQQAALISIPRDTYLDTDAHWPTVGAAYVNGGTGALREAVSRTLGIPIDYCIQVDMDGFVSLVDEVGGIDLSVPCEMDYDDPHQGLSIHYTEGVQHLDGQQALEVCRFRRNNDLTGYADAGRTETQRAVLSAVVQKLCAWENLLRLRSFAEIAASHVETDLSLPELLWFAGQALNFDPTDLYTASLSGELREGLLLYLDAEETLSTVNQYLNPYIADRTADQLDSVPSSRQEQAVQAEEVLADDSLQWAEPMEVDGGRLLVGSQRPEEHGSSGRETWVILEQADGTQLLLQDGGRSTPEWVITEEDSLYLIGRYYGLSTLSGLNVVRYTITEETVTAESAVAEESLGEELTIYPDENNSALRSVLPAAQAGDGHLSFHAWDPDTRSFTAVLLDGGEAMTFSLREDGLFWLV